MKKFIKSSNQKELDRIQKIVAKVNDFENEISKLSESEFPKKTEEFVKSVKNEKLKVQTQIQGDQVRVTGKKRDDLQKVMAIVKELDLDIPIEFNNFRD